MEATLVIGINSRLGKELLKYDIGNKIIGVDIQQDLESEVSCKYFRIRNDNDSGMSDLIRYLKKGQLLINKIVFLSGVNYMTDFYTVEKKQWMNAYSVNLNYFLFTLKKIYSFFSNKTSIVCIASQNGVVAHEYRLDYSTSKAALIQLVKNLSVDFSQTKEKDIKINCVSPSYILTDDNHLFFQSVFGKKLVDRIPYKRLPKVEDVVHTILFLLSDGSEAIRGQNIIVDYGYTII